MQNQVDTVSFTWRTDKALRDWLESRAKNNRRSMNAELYEIVNAAKEAEQQKAA